MDRKEMIKALEEQFQVKAKYMRAPSFAYEIMIQDRKYTIDRVGKITTPEGFEVEFEMLISGQLDKEVEEKQQVENEPTTIAVEVAVPMEGHNGRTLRNLVNTIYSKQLLIKKVFELEENIIDEDFSIGINEVKIETLEDFKRVVEDIGAASCPGTEFDFFENIITFKFYNDTGNVEKFRAFQALVALVNTHSKIKKHVSAKVAATDNEKYIFRTWLVRLGMVGAEYKVIRKILLENLTGNSAFR